MQTASGHEHEDTQDCAPNSIGKFTSVSESAVRDGDRVLRWEMASIATMRMRHAAMQSSRQLSHWSAMRNEKYALQQKQSGVQHLNPDYRTESGRKAVDQASVTAQ
jgi:hypothetical protein